MEFEQKGKAKTNLKSIVLTALATLVIVTIPEIIITHYLTNISAENAIIATENAIVNELGEYFTSVDENMSYKKAIATVYEENQNLQTQVQEYQKKEEALTEQISAVPNITFSSPELVQDGLKISDGINNGVARINGRVYIAEDAVDPFLEGTITYDEEQDILANGDTEGTSVTKVDLFSTQALYDGVQYSIIPNDNQETLLVAGEEYRNGILLGRSYLDDCYALFNLDNEYSALHFAIGRQDGSDKTDIEIEIYLDEKLSKTYEISSDTPIQTLEVPLHYAKSMKLRIVAEDYFQYCVVNPVLVK